MAVTHVIFDFDGLLVDTEPCYKAVHKELLGRYGRTFTPEIGSHMMGRREEDAFTWLLNEVWISYRASLFALAILAVQLNIADKITPRQYMAEYDAMLTEMFRHCQPMPGAERLVRHFHKKGMA
ncbi:hypothetical protein ANCDUO_02704 [Ancylostoma duodenale]|uniref:Haloacid dehalogenase-like hydrolase n=1 Tax=Ancylostoma duodenale TaxID=51022 RepID=A0A0C2DVS3_9BILA|nr:hypothetical protein ANCDUO_02704 [Ancylostoma duodenale]